MYNNHDNCDYSAHDNRLSLFSISPNTNKCSTISTVKPLLYKLLSKTLEAQDDDSTTLRDMKMAVKSDLSRRYQKDDVKDVMNRVTFLDPRYKELPFLSDGEKSQVMR